MDITSLLGNVMDKDMLEKISKSAKVSTADVSNVLKNALRFCGFLFFGGVGSAAGSIQPVINVAYMAS